MNQNIPQTVAIIMDGNGRWAKKRGLPRTAGHKQGADTIRTVALAANELGIKKLILYAFSTENWRRPQEEVDGLMKLFIEYIDKNLDRLNEEGIFVRAIGDINGLSQKVQDKFRNAYEVTKNNSDVIFNIAVNYGGRQEIVYACRQLAKACEEGKMHWEDIDTELFAYHLDTGGQPDPDLLIRSSGEMRLSNFMLWQVAYSEIWITDTLWPDFTAGDLYDAVYSYQKRDRRFGGLKK